MNKSNDTSAITLMNEPIDKSGENGRLDRVSKNLNATDNSASSSSIPKVHTEVDRDKSTTQIRIDMGVDNRVEQEMTEDHKWVLSKANLYLNRELTWLNFNRRVLYEAENEKNPLLERLKFIAIAAYNIDEFFMKRIGGLKGLTEAKILDRSIDGRTPHEQLNECYIAIRDFEKDMTTIFPHLIKLLQGEGIQLLKYQELNRNDKSLMRDYFIKNIFPLITPQGLGPAHPFPFISNLSLNLLVSIRIATADELSLARIKVPVGNDTHRFISVDAQNNRFVMIEDIIENNLDLLFPSVEIVSCELFRVTRNANTEKDEEQADDLLELIETELKDRKFAPLVRLQVLKGMNPMHLGMLSNQLGLNQNDDVFEIEGMIGKRDLMEFANLHRPELKYRPFHPIDPPRLKGESNIFYSLREEGSILLYHPYESFTSSVERFLKEAADDPKVRAIKMTLYRTSGDTKVISYLSQAIQNQKQVAVVVELKARFDEEANILWANKLEEMGIHVTYGVIGLKTHVKAILVVRKDFDGLRTYCHFGTGNYHAGTARMYTDFGLLTCDPDIGRDLTELFNFLTTGQTAQRKYKKLIVAPAYMKKEIHAKIEREIKLHSPESPGQIQMKFNSLDDQDITEALYRASQAGVKIDLIVRGTCRIRPGVPGLSDNLRVTSIIGRFLEHARVFYFRNGGNDEYYIGSADLMRRNLNFRIEVLAPIEDPALKKELRQILDIQFNDRYSAWEMLYDGSYIRKSHFKDKLERSSQEYLIDLAEKRKKAAGKVKWLKSRGKSKKEFWAGYKE